jgi:hypothetical protein
MIFAFYSYSTRSTFKVQLKYIPTEEFASRHFNLAPTCSHCALWPPDRAAFFSLSKRPSETGDISSVWTRKSAQLSGLREWQSPPNESFEHERDSLTVYIPTQCRWCNNIVPDITRSHTRGIFLRGGCDGHWVCVCVCVCLPSTINNRRAQHANHRDQSKNYDVLHRTWQGLELRSSLSLNSHWMPSMFLNIFELVLLGLQLWTLP